MKARGGPKNRAGAAQDAGGPGPRRPCAGQPRVCQPPAGVTVTDQLNRWTRNTAQTATINHRTEADMISRPLYHRGTSKNLNRISQVENNDGQKNNGGQIKQKKNKRQECNLWYFSKFKLGMGIQNGQSRIGGRPQLQKKELEFCTMADDDGCTAPRVHEPVG